MMTREELDMEQIPAALAARAMNVSVKSIHSWFGGDKLAGEQTVSGRLWVTVGSCRALIRERRGPNSMAEQDFDHILNSEGIPPSPFPKDRPQGRLQPRRDVISCA